MLLIERRGRSGEFTRARARRGGPGDRASEEEAASKSILFVRGREGMTGHPFW